MYTFQMSWFIYFLLITVVMSEDKDPNSNGAMDGVRLGACDILIKPLCSQKAQFLCQHALRRMDNSKLNKKTISDRLKLRKWRGAPITCKRRND